MGQKFAAWDAEGGRLVFYDSDDSPVPDGVTAIEVSDSQWMTCLKTPGYVIANGVLVPPSDEYLLAAAKAAQFAAIDQACAAAVREPVTFKNAAGLSKTYAADASSQATLIQAAQGYGISGEVPSGFFWGAADGANVPFTLGDLRDLNQAMLDQSWAASQKRKALKDRIDNAASVEDVQTIEW